MFDFNTETGQIRIYGIITQYGHDDEFPGEISPTDLMKAFDAMDGKDVTIIVKSEGGEISSGLSMFNQIENYSGRVIAEVDAQAASISSVFILAADEVLMRRRSELFIHDPWSIVMGNAVEFRKTADYLDALAMEIASVYADRAGGTVQSWFDRMRETERFSSEEALEEGLIDGIVGKVHKHHPKDQRLPGPVARMNWALGNSLDKRRRARQATG